MPGPSAANKLLRWYDKHQRQLPWRSNASGYETLVAETMLQQTQVKTVIPYYRRFLKAFPNFVALAQADESALLTCWSGLGYYRRARYLQQSAQEVITHYHGRLPTEADELRKLPGIGSYTANAIASIAFAKPVAVVDGNVKRVISRLHGIRDDVSRSKTLQKIEAVANEMLCRKRPGDFNQALMELGATLCSRSKPQCHCCPLQHDCVAYKKNLQEQIPKPQATRQTVALIGSGALVTSKQGKVLLIADAPKPLKRQGLLEIPVIWHKRERALMSHLKKQYGVTSKFIQPLGKVRHGVMHYRMQIDLFRLQAERLPRSQSHHRHLWLKPTEADQQPLSGLCHKVLKYL